MIRRMAGSCDSDDISGTGQPAAAREGTNCRCPKIERHGIEPAWPAMWEIAAQSSRPAARHLQLARRHQDFAVRKMSQSSVMIHVQMGQHHLLHVPWSDTERTQLRTNLLLALNPERDFPSDIGMVRLRAFEQVRSLTGVDHHDAFGMFDGPGIGRQPIGPVAVTEDGEPSAQAVAAAFHLRGLDPDRAGLDGVNTHGGFPFLLASMDRRGPQSSGATPHWRDLGNGDTI